MRWNKTGQGVLRACSESGIGRRTHQGAQEIVRSSCITVKYRHCKNRKHIIEISDINIIIAKFFFL